MQSQLEIHVYYSAYKSVGRLIMSIFQSLFLFCKEFVSRLDLQPGQKVLDVGCGIGGSAFYMVKVTRLSKVEDTTKIKKRKWIISFSIIQLIMIFKKQPGETTSSEITFASVTQFLWSSTVACNYCFIFFIEFWSQSNCN